MTITATVKRPRFMDHIHENPVTSRTCECGEPAGYVSGYYLTRTGTQEFATKRVRVWTCLTHYSGNPSLVLPTPKWLLDLDKRADAFTTKKRKSLRFVDAERGESVKVLASSGTGDPVFPTRAEMFRWMPESRPTVRKSKVKKVTVL